MVSSALEPKKSMVSLPPPPSSTSLPSPGSHWKLSSSAPIKIVSFPCCPSRKSFPAPPSSESAPWLLGVGAFGAFGQLAMTRAYGHGSTLVTAALSYSGIVFASVIGIAVFGDRLPLVAWLGIALIVAAGIAAVMLRPDRREDAASQVTND